MKAEITILIGAILVILGVIAISYLNLSPLQSTSIVAPSGMVEIKHGVVGDACSAGHTGTCLMPNYACPSVGYTQCEYQVYCGNSLYKDVILQPGQSGAASTGGTDCYLFGTPVQIETTTLASTTTTTTLLQQEATTTTTPLMVTTTTNFVSNPTTTITGQTTTTLYGASTTTTLHPFRTDCRTDQIVYCLDGTTRGRNPQNNCEFDKCPSLVNPPINALDQIIRNMIKFFYGIFYALGGR